MKPEPILKRLQHPAINKSWFARKFHGIDEKHDYKINTFLNKSRGNGYAKFTKEEIKRLEVIFKELIIELIWSNEK